MLHYGSFLRLWFLPPSLHDLPRKKLLGIAIAPGFSRLSTAANRIARQSDRRSPQV
jgi:hypothetical protein